MGCETIRVRAWSGEGLDVHMASVRQEAQEEERLPNVQQRRRESQQLRRQKTPVQLN